MNTVKKLNTVITARISLITRHLFFASVVAGALVGCASKDTRFGLEDDSVWEQSQASGAAYAADAMTFRKTMKIRPKNDFRFYYKNCELTDHESFYSKTSYWCSEGP